MKLLAFLLALGAVLGDNFLPRKISESPEVELWKKWKELHQKEYESEVEEVKRFEIWLENLKFVKDNNVAYDLGLKTYKTSVNEMADLTLDEYVASKSGAKSSKPTSFPMTGQTFFDHSLIGGAPASKDWRQDGRVTPVKDQGQCDGSSWSFSTTGAVEALMKNVTGNLVSLSEQELIDCDYWCYGCRGGLIKPGYQYINMYGILREQDYPYEGVRRSCRRGKRKYYGYLTDFFILPPGDEHTLEYVVGTKAPVSGFIDTRHRSFQLYQAGVYYEPSCGNEEGELDHAILVVGYGTYIRNDLEPKLKIDYWIVKNSWGTKWGQQGYIWMVKGFSNNCGIATHGLFPVAS